MQHQLFGGPLKSSDEMENIGEKVGILTEQVAVRENTKPGDSGGEEIEMKRRETSSVTYEHRNRSKRRCKVVCRKPSLIIHTKSNTPTLRACLSVAVSVVMMQHYSYWRFIQYDTIIRHFC